MSTRKSKDGFNEEEIGTFEARHRDVLDLLENVWRKGNSDTAPVFNSAVNSTLTAGEKSHAAREHSPKITDDDHPRKIGRFEIIQLLGHGGHGLVYLAWDPRLKRNVALKIPRPEVIVTADLRKRFLRESELAASLTHPNILPIYEAGNYGPICYIASAYCQGSTLADWSTSQQPLSPKRAAQIMVVLADAVQHAHLRGVIHRDLKPANILVEQPDSQDKSRSVDSDGGSQNDFSIYVDSQSRHLWISDFGLAKCVDPSIDQQQSLTQTGTIVGTPAYMSPEQVDGAAGGVSALSDVYSLGAILYFLLSGQPPLAGETILETLRQVREQTPTPLHRIRKQIPRDLEAICFKCLEKHPARRYHSAADLSADVQRFIDGMPVVARPLSVGQRAIRWSEQNPLLSIASGAAVTFFLLGLIATSIGWYSTSRALHRETLAKRSAEQASLQAEQRYWQAKKTVDQYFTQVANHQLLDIPGLTPLRQDLLQMALGFYQQFLDENQGDEEVAFELASTHFQAGRILQLVNQPSEALEHFLTGLQILDLLSDSESSDFSVKKLRWQTLEKVGQAHLTLGNADQALFAVEEALETLAAWVDENTAEPEILTVFTNLLNQGGLIQQELNQPALAEQQFREAIRVGLEVYETAPNEEEAESRLNGYRHNLANVLKRLGEMAEAEQLADETLQYRRQMAQRPSATFSDRRLLVIGLHDRSLYHLMRREFQNAIPLLEESTRIAGELMLAFPHVVQYHTLQAQSSGTLAVAYAQNGQLEPAIEYFAVNERALAQVLKLDPGSVRTSIDLAGAKLNYAATLAQHTEQLDDARQLFSEAEELFREVIESSPESPLAKRGLLNCLVNLSGLESNKRNYQAALNHAKDSLEIVRDLLTSQPENPDLGRLQLMSTSCLATALDGLERSEEAIDQWQEYIENSPNQPSAAANLQLAASLAKAGRSSEAAEVILEFEDQLATNPRLHFHLARACAALASRMVNHETSSESSEQAAVVDSDDWKTWIDKCLTALNRAAELGHFRLSWQFESLNQAPEFELLRQRPEFDQWRATLEKTSHAPTVTN